MSGDYLSKNELDRLNELIKAAKGMLERSYAPYSEFNVGAALLTEDGRIFTGCNVENGAFSPSVCAERTAFVKAVSEGADRFKAICIVGGKKGKIEGRCYPCGVCRQVMAEFCDPESFEIILPDETDTVEILTLSELLPRSFNL